MTKDYKNISEPKKKSNTNATTQSDNPLSGGMPGWVWLLAGLVIGSFVSFLVYLKTNINVDQPASSQVQENKPSAKTSPAEPASNAGEDRFKFYDILPKREVSVPVEQTLEPRKEKVEARENTKEQTTVKTSDDVYYYELQAGSFVHFKDADKRKANLAFLGIQAKIQAVKSSSNKTLYRVRIGPYNDVARINEIEKTLKQNNIKSLLVTTRG